MRTGTRLATAAALAAVVAVGLPAAAHSPRDTEPGAPRMDLEVLVTPAVTGRTTPGGTDAVVAVDSFGNRFAVARKEDAQTAVGVDQRARTAARATAWQWFSEDEGSTWRNFETLPRGAEVALPQGLGRDLASDGPRTYYAESTAAGTLVTRITATKRARFAADQLSVAPVLAAPGGRTSLAVGGRTVAVVSTSPGGGSSLAVSVDGGASWPAVATSLPLSGCDVAVDRRTGAVSTACLDQGMVVLQQQRGATTSLRRLGAADRRGGDDAEPSVDVAPDGTVHVLSGMRLWSVAANGRVLRTQDVQSEGRVHRATTLAVSKKGRVGVAAYRRVTDTSWHVVVTVFTPGRAPVWSDFAFHDAVAPEGAAAPPSDRLSVDFDELDRVQLLWTSTFLHDETLDRPLLRNVWAVRSTTT